MTLKETFESILCDPDGVVCIKGSDTDREILQKALEQVSVLENFLPDEKELNELVAQGYVTERNSEKTLDPDLLEDIVSIIFKRLRGGKE